MKNRKYLGLQDIRKIEKNTRVKKIKELTGQDMNNFLKNPYSYLKTRYISETSSLLVYVLQFTNISPNFVTSTYVFCGLSVGFLLATDNLIAICIGLFISFSKSTIDWADGFLAKIKNKTSQLGHVLDCWGAQVGSYSFLIGVGFYAYNKDSEIIFIVLAILILLFKAIDLKNYAYHLDMYDLVQKKNKKKYLNKLNINFKKTSFSKNKNYLKIIKEIIISIFDDRSRSVDFILLIIIIDLFFYETNLIKYIYFIIFLKTLLLFSGGLYLANSKNFIFKK